MRSPGRIYRVRKKKRIEQSPGNPLLMLLEEKKSVLEPKGSRQKGAGKYTEYVMLLERSVEGSIAWQSVKVMQ